VFQANNSHTVKTYTHPFYGLQKLLRILVKSVDSFFGLGSLQKAAAVFDKQLEVRFV